MIQDELRGDARGALRSASGIVPCYIFYKVLAARLLHRGANSSASREGRSGKGDQRNLEKKKKKTC
ncbi:hypothetical protein EYF80_021612 [Liparis tanakae]|uniref:Uncharacterized protein n=1 Tax=Liparis tanakae TaxID=230148 RepID=A0A4Z2HQL2_9TELE|nr:hypothetical protein EYF80_021612 [Liparis tanakae]